MLEDFNFGLGKKFNIKCGIDIIVFLIVAGSFISMFMKHEIDTADWLVYSIVLIGLFLLTHFITRMWISDAIKKYLSQQSSTVSNATSEMIELFNSQKKIFENLSENTKILEIIDFCDNQLFTEKTTYISILIFYLTLYTSMSPRTKLSNKYHHSHYQKVLRILHL